jgi:hypothetical protein
MLLTNHVMIRTAGSVISNRLIEDLYFWFRLGCACVVVRHVGSDSADGMQLYERRYELSQSDNHKAIPRLVIHSSIHLHLSPEQQL